MAQLHRGPRQRAAVPTDDDGQGELEAAAQSNLDLWSSLSTRSASIGNTLVENRWDRLTCLDWDCSFRFCPHGSVLLFQAVVAGIQQAHAEQLANMRIQDLNVSLKPLNSVNNPILRKRKLLGYDRF